MPYLLKANSLFHRKKSLAEQKEPNEGYFCSELVATLYQRLGLLPLEVAATSYWPGNFSTEKEDI